jgi:long-chain acyl-CoA synthetase
MIIRNGYNVYPHEVEEVLNRHPGVVSAAVFGVAHEVYGQEVYGQEVAAAVVVPAPGSTVTAEQLEYVRAQIAAYKYPRIMKLIPELPMPERENPQTRTHRSLRRQLHRRCCKG